MTTQRQIITGHEADIEATENAVPMSAEEAERARARMELDAEGKSILADFFSGDDEKAKDAIRRSIEKANRAGA